jgi:hypothetical protein
MYLGREGKDDFLILNYIFFFELQYIKMWEYLVAVIVLVVILMLMGYIPNPLKEKPAPPAEEFQPKPRQMKSNAAANEKALDEDDDGSWMDIVKQTELDPSIEDNHARFVRDATRFSSGANFTAVADDNTNPAFTNFIGLRRPSHVAVGPDARQIPDIDENVLQRNKPFRFN